MGTSAPIRPDSAPEADRGYVLQAQADGEVFVIDAFAEEAPDP